MAETTLTKAEKSTIDRLANVAGELEAWLLDMRDDEGFLLENSLQYAQVLVNTLTSGVTAILEGK